MATQSQRGVRVDYELVQGKTWELPILVTGLDNNPVDLTSATITAMARLDATDLLPAFMFTVTKAANQGSTGMGQATLSIPAPATALVESSKYIYDIEVVYGGKTYELQYGSIKVRAEVSR